MKHIKIALTGKMRSGKDTVYGILKDEIESPSLGDKAQVTQYTFGGQLKHFAHELFPDKLSKGKPRKLYQEFGQLMRQIDPNVWVNQVHKKISQVEDYAVFVDEHNSIVVSIITDLRQPNEYKYCRDNGFHIIRIKASDKTRMARMKAEGDNVSLGDLQHETETYVDSYGVDYEIDNDSLSSSSIYSIELQVEKIVADILTKEDGNNEQI